MTQFITADDFKNQQQVAYNKFAQDVNDRLKQQLGYMNDGVLRVSLHGIDYVSGNRDEYIILAKQTFKGFSDIKFGWTGTKDDGHPSLDFYL